MEKGHSSVVVKKLLPFILGREALTIGLSEVKLIPNVAQPVNLL